MKIVLLDAKTLGADLDLSPLDQFGEVIRYETSTPEETSERIKDAALIISNKALISAKAMDAAPSLNSSVSQQQVPIMLTWKLPKHVILLSKMLQGIQPLQWYSIPLP